MYTKSDFLSILSELNVDLTNFTKYLDSNRVRYFDKPYNNYENNAYAGSLCDHSVKLYYELVKLSNLYFTTEDMTNVYSKEDLIKASLLANIYRAELYEPYNKNVKNEVTGQWESVVSYKTKDNRPSFGSIGLSSYMIAKKFFDISDEVAMAIIYACDNSAIDLFTVKKLFPLVNLIQMAESAVLYT